MNGLARIGLVLIFTGVALAFVAALLPAILFSMAIASQPEEATPAPSNGTDIGVGGCVLIFFIPICFGYGTGHLPITALIIVLALAAVMIVLTFLLFRSVVPRPRIMGSP